jgi:hypothetical protein
LLILPHQFHPSLYLVLSNVHLLPYHR